MGESFPRKGSRCCPRWPRRARFRQRSGLPARRQSTRNQPAVFPGSAPYLRPFNLSCGNCEFLDREIVTENCTSDGRFRRTGPPSFGFGSAALPFKRGRTAADSAVDGAIWCIVRIRGHIHAARLAGVPEFSMFESDVRTASSASSTRRINGFKNTCRPPCRFGGAERKSLNCSNILCKTAIDPAHPSDYTCIGLAVFFLGRGVKSLVRYHRSPRPDWPAFTLHLEAAV